MKNQTPFDVVVVAAGSSERMASAVPKVLLPLGNESVLGRTILSFLFHNNLQNIILVVRKEDESAVLDIVAALPPHTVPIHLVTGGATRSESVQNGLLATKSPFVLIHDGARPFVSPALLERVLEGVATHGSAIPALPVSDSIREVHQEQIIGYPTRQNYKTVQTPQAFRTDEILRAYQMRGAQVFTDDSELYAMFIAPPHIVEGDAANKKITSPSDYFGLNAQIGFGYDLHRLIPNRKLVLGGIELASPLGTLAHSDGDAVIHALMDALLSAVGETDIGTHFPNTDPIYQDADSAVLLSHVVSLLRKKNKTVQNVSLVIVLDQPKLKDDIPVMKIKLANLLGIPTQNIGISAKTTEGTNPNSVASYAVVLVS